MFMTEVLLEETQTQQHSGSGLQEKETGVGKKVRNCLVRCWLLQYLIRMLLVWVLASGGEFLFVCSFATSVSLVRIW